MEFIVASSDSQGNVKTLAALVFLMSQWFDFSDASSF